MCIVTPCALNGMHTGRSFLHPLGHPLPCQQRAARCRSCRRPDRHAHCMQSFTCIRICTVMQTAAPCSSHRTMPARSRSQCCLAVHEHHSCHHAPTTACHATAHPTPCHSALRRSKQASSWRRRLASRVIYPACLADAHGHEGKTGLGLMAEGCDGHAHSLTLSSSPLSLSPLVPHSNHSL